MCLFWHSNWCKWHSGWSQWHSSHIIGALVYSTLYCNRQNYPFPVLVPWWCTGQWSGMPVGLNGTLVGACHLNFGTPVFVVKKTTGTDDKGYMVMNTSTLAVDPLIKSPGYVFTQEDPSIYDDHLDPDHFCARREWPEVSLPRKSTTTANKELIKDLQANHDNTTLLLKSLGVDACCELKQNQVESVIARVRPGTNVCKFCNKKVKDHQQLKTHIRSWHCKESKYRCTICNLSFGEAFTLKGIALSM